MRAAEAATARDTVFPRAWLRRLVRLQLLGAQDRGTADHRRTRADEGLPADDPGRALPDAVVAELAWGFQDSVVDVLVTKTIRAAEASRARSIVLGGGVAANAALRDAAGRRGGRAAAIAHRARGRACARTTAR